jgi:hypothetical protein
MESADNTHSFFSTGAVAGRALGVCAVFALASEALRHGNLALHNRPAGGAKNAPITGMISTKRSAKNFYPPLTHAKARGCRIRVRSRHSPCMEASHA